MLKLFNTLFSKTGTDYKQLMQDGAVILDVRTPEEYKAGHIKGSKNMPLNEIRANAEKIKKWNTKVITVCRSGARSSSAKNILENQGIEVFNGGAWTELNKKIK